MDKDLKCKTFSEIEKLVAQMGQKAYWAGYIFNFIQARGVNDVSQIETLSKDFRKELAEQGYFISQLKTSDKLTDPDGTIKYVFELPDGGRIESVLLYDDSRKTLCVSTQAGCAMKCEFCATGKIKLKRNLTAGEIVDQVNIVSKDQGKVTNVVYMGMGEPLQNYENVLKSVAILNHSKGQNIGIRHLAVSTCGMIPGILKLADEEIQPRLAISLNAPTDSLRKKLMPAAGKYLLKDLLRAIRIYQHKTRQRVTFEYILIKAVNDTAKDAQLLACLINNIMCNINLIEYNPHPGCSFKASSKETIMSFENILKRAGIETTIRLKKGQSIKAACGQLGADRINKS